MIAYHRAMEDRQSQAGPPGPDSPAAALAGDLLAQARDRAFALLLSALEHLVRQQSWARDRLRAHAGRTVRVAVDADALPALPGLPAPDARMTIDDDGFLRRAAPGAPADATLVMRPSVDALFALLREGPQGVQRHLRIEGDVTLAATLGELAQHLRWDAEEDLSRVVGDVAAHRLVRAAGGLLARLRDLGTRAETAAAQFAAGGTQVAVRPQMRELLDAAAALEQRVQALETRAARLARGV